MKSTLLILLAVAIALIMFPNHRSAAASAKDNADTLRHLEGEFMRAAADKGSAGYMAYYADNAVEVPNGEAIIQGKVNIAKTMGFLDDKNNRLTWTPVGADISSSGDLGTPTARMNSVRKTKTARLWSLMASTPASGRSSRMEAGRLFSTWGIVMLRSRSVSPAS